MARGKYPWAERYGWCEDRFGVNWQLMVGERARMITPALLFANARYGRAEAAIRHYVSVFEGSGVQQVDRDPATGAVRFAAFTLGGTPFVAMEGPLEPAFDFSCGTSFIVPCASQAELDRTWDALSAVPEAEQCGWLVDAFGVSWQLVHEDWGKLMSTADPARRDRLMGAILKMKKPDIAALLAAAG
jgi:predicted 3-demethylubiquinone-9 3-methyltransferase (glyoxalase superfamily)